MPRIYRKVILGHQTNMFKCSDCMDKANLPTLDWDDTVLPGEGNPGVWEEAPLDKCDYCYAVDGDSSEEMYEWSAEMDRQHWDEDQRMWEDHIAPDTYNPQELK